MITNPRQKLNIVEAPDAILKIPCEPVTNVLQYEELAKDMVYTLEQSNSGVGLAANQVGHSIRLIIVKVNSTMIMFNPKIVKTSKGMISCKEGCLSFPGEEKVNRRFKWVAVEFQNEKGEKIRRKLFDLEAVCVQHEIDHLNGVTFLER